MQVEFWEPLSSAREDIKTPWQELLEYWAKGENDDDSHFLEGGVWDFGYIFGKDLNWSYDDVKSKIDFIKKSNILQFEYMQYMKYI